jgi:hypothetical protein
LPGRLFTFKFDSALFRDRRSFDCDHLALELGRFRGHRAVTADKESSGPEHDNRDACRNLIVRSLLILCARDLCGTRRHTLCQLRARQVLVDERRHVGWRDFRRFRCTAGKRRQREQYQTLVSQKIPPENAMVGTRLIRRASAEAATTERRSPKRAKPSPDRIVVAPSAPDHCGSRTHNSIPDATAPASVPASA